MIMSKELLDELLKGCERPEDLCAKRCQTLPSELKRRAKTAKLVGTKS